MEFCKKHTIFSKQVIISLLFLLFSPAIVLSQNQDSLLEKIKDIDITLNEPIDSDEDLYMNTVSFQSFYDVLSPMGEWIQITKEDVDNDLNDGEGNGYSSVSAYFDEDNLLFIWKPSVEKDWKPYMNGKWEYTDHGWFWVSADKWGNSTYNYGRWWNSPKYGWVWLPGYTWAPSWVRWKVSNDDKYVGWVALSPKAKWNRENGITDENYKFKNKDNDWVFVDNSNFAGEITSDKTVNQKENSSLVKNSSTVTDIKSEEDVITNKGLDVNRMEEKTGKKFNRKRLRFRNGNSNTIVGENEITVGKEVFKRYQHGQEENIGKPNKFRKSERVKKMLRKRNSHRKPPMRNK